MRFSLRAVFVSIFLVAVCCGIVFALPPMWSIALQCILMVSIPAAVISGVIYSRGYARAFWIGCASAVVIPYLPMVYFGISMGVTVVAGLVGLEDMSGDFDEIAPMRFLCAIGYLTIFASGVTAMVVRWFSIDREKPTTFAPRPQSVLHRRIVVESQDAART